MGLAKFTRFKKWSYRWVLNHLNSFVVNLMSPPSPYCWRKRSLVWFELKLAHTPYISLWINYELIVLWVFVCVCSWKWQMSLSWSRQLFKCLSLFHRIGQSDSGLSLLLHIHIYIHTHTHTQSVHSHFCFNSLVSIVKVASVLLLLLFLSVPCASHYFIRWRTIRAENFIRWFFAFYSIPTKDFDKRTRKKHCTKTAKKEKKAYTYIHLSNRRTFIVDLFDLWMWECVTVATEWYKSSKGHFTRWKAQWYRLILNRKNNNT